MQAYKCGKARFKALLRRPWLAALSLDYDFSIVLSVAVVMPSVIAVTVTAHDDGPVTVAMISSVGPDDLSVAVPMAFADPHVQFLRERRHRNANGSTRGHEESNLAHFSNS
jgi:hypothetical protein